MKYSVKPPLVIILSPPQRQPNLICASFQFLLYIYIFKHICIYKQYMVFLYVLNLNKWYHIMWLFCNSLFSISLMFLRSHWHILMWFLHFHCHIKLHCMNRWWVIDHSPINLEQLENLVYFQFFTISSNTAMLSYMSPRIGNVATEEVPIYNFTRSFTINFIRMWLYFFPPTSAIYEDYSFPTTMPIPGIVKQ